MQRRSEWDWIPGRRVWLRTEARPLRHWLDAASKTVSDLLFSVASHLPTSRETRQLSWQLSTGLNAPETRIDAPTEIYEIQDCQYSGVMDWGKSLEENIILPNQSFHGKICTTYVQSSPIYQPLFCNNSIKTIWFNSKFMWFMFKKLTFCNHIVINVTLISERIIINDDLSSMVVYHHHHFNDAIMVRTTQIWSARSAGSSSQDESCMVHKVGGTEESERNVAGGTTDPELSH